MVLAWPERSSVASRLASRQRVPQSVHTSTEEWLGLSDGGSLRRPRRPAGPSLAWAKWVETLEPSRPEPEAPPAAPLIDPKRVQRGNQRQRTEFWLKETTYAARRAGRRRLALGEDRRPQAADVPARPPITPASPTPKAAPESAPASLDAALERAPEPPPKSFWFVLGTELVVHGATDPSATVTCQGRPVEVRDDGTFTLRFALPDGARDIPCTATSATGTERITITPRVTKETLPEDRSGD